MKKNDTLLIVEDEENILYGMQSVLSCHLDFISEVYTARNGKEALTIIQNKPVSMIVTDLRMPEMDGIEATFRLRDKGVKTPIIAVTAFAFDQDRNRILEAGCDDYISKPIFSAILKERIRYWLNEKRKL